MKDGEKSIGVKFAIQLLIAIILVIFSVEFCIMLALHYIFPSLPFLLETVVDSLSLIVLLFPFIYGLVFRPLLAQLMERKKTEEKLKASVRQAQEIVDGSSAVIFVKDLEGKYLLINSLYERLFHISKEKILGKTDYDIFPKEAADAFRNVDQKALNENREVRAEESVPQDDGIHYYISLKFPLYTIENKPYAVCGIATDITERKQMEQQLQKYSTGLEKLIEERTTELSKSKEDLEIQAWGLAKANEGIKVLYKELETKTREMDKLNQVKSDFISTVSHELRTPLTTMKEFISILLDEIPGKINKEQKEYLNIVQGNIDRLTRIIASLLDISKIEAKKMELDKNLVNIETLVKGVVSGFKSRTDAKHITMETVFPRVLSDVYVDSDRITQVFTNLIDNAIKFTPEKGKIVVEIKVGKKEIECSVSDTGIGIAPEDRDKLFEKFVQIGRTPGSGTKGTGLGLAIIKDLVQLHNGKIWVESEPDKGSKFIFTLPKIKAEEIFEEYIINGLKEVADRKSFLSLIVVHIVEFSQLQKKWGEKPLYVLTDIEKVIKGSLRRKADTVLRSTGELAIPLSDTRKEDAEVVKKRIEEAIKTYLSQSKEEWIKEIRITLGSATYPDEANNHQELLGKARGGGGAGYYIKEVKRCQ